MNKKFELLNDDTIEWFGRKLFRIKAKINFGIVKEGELGGYVEKERLRQISLSLEKFQRTGDVEHLEDIERILE